MHSASKLRAPFILPAVVTSLSLLGAARAQNTVSALDLHPLSAPPQYAGVFDYDNQRWLSPRAQIAARASSIPVYDNTCTWSGGGFYTGVGDCEDYLADGRVPGGLGGNNPPGATVDNQINFFEFAYCTSTLTGAVDIKVGFYDSLGGPCLGAVAPTPPSLASQAVRFYDFGANSGFPLPGSSTAGSLACFVVGVTSNHGFCLQSDGDGVFDNSALLDNFNWSFQLESPPSAGGPIGGVVIAGEPLFSAPGGCTYNIPCGGGPFGSACGHGLGAFDGHWINVDAANPNCLSAPGAGSNCYWFGGHPGNPFASFYLKLGSAGSCVACTGDPVSYCTAGTSANGCTPTMSLSGTPSVSTPQPVVLTASNVDGQRAGLIFVGLSPQGVPWAPSSTSFLCVKPPLARLPAQNSGGASGQCNGALSADLNAYLVANGNLLLGVAPFSGLLVHAQGWYRDPASPKSTSLTDALTLTYCP